MVAMLEDMPRSTIMAPHTFTLNIQKLRSPVTPSRDALLLQTLPRAGAVIALQAHEFYDIMKL